MPKIDDEEVAEALDEMIELESHEEVIEHDLETRRVFVALVDDDALIRRACLRVFHRAPRETMVREFNDAESLIAAVNDESYAPDFIVTDNDLGPGLRGTELMQWASKTLPDARVVLYSGNDEAVATVREKNLLALSKPATTQEMLEIMGLGS